MRLKMQCRIADLQLSGCVWNSANPLATTHEDLIAIGPFLFP